ncbi:hypothetical protein ACFWVU_07915 [Streptomyces sp. NPDC058686]|uniref:hypothetical protein n=1 Tax=Streptomyces sp. NPDC058686 TaxID=3346599 RepID=UPI003647F402
MSKHATLEATMPGPSSAIIDHLLGELWERGGSDLLLTAGSAPFLRVDGALRPVEGAALTEPEVDRLVTGVLGKELTERFRREKQVDFAFSWGEKARLRGNAFVQRGASALALRIIPFDVPSSEQLGLPPATSLAALLDYVNTHRSVHILTSAAPRLTHGAAEKTQCRLSPVCDNQRLWSQASATHARHSQAYPGDDFALDLVVPAAEGEDHG